MYTLLIYDAQKNLASRVELSRDSVTIGRDPTCELPFPDINISRKHARIEPMGRFYVIRDLQSTNGTWVNENPIKMHLLKARDVVRIGGYRMVVEVDRESSSLGMEEPFEEGPHTEIIDDPFAYDLTSDSTHTLRLDVGGEKLQLPGQQSSRERVLRLHEISGKLGFIETPAMLYGRVVEIVQQELKADRASLLIPEEEEMRNVAAFVVKEEREKAFNIHHGILRTATDDRTAILAEDATQDKRFQGQTNRPGEHRERSVMCVPLVAGTNLEGVVYVDRTINPKPFTEDDLRFLTVICNQVAISLANARLFEEVLTEKQKVQMIVSSLKDGLVITDQKLEVQSWNAAAAEILFPMGGYPVGMNLLKLILTRDPSVQELEFHESVREGRDFSVMVTRDQEVRAYTVSFASFSPEEEDGLKGFAFSFRDTTDLLHLQELKSEFIRSASHKLRTPLTILMGNLDIVRTMLADPSVGDDLEGLVEGMANNLKQLEGLVSRFLEFAELDRTRFRHEEIHLREVVAMAEAGILTRAEEKNIKISNLVPEGSELLVVQGDPDRLVQCLLNILDNAVKFAPRDSSVRITAEAGEDRIRIHVEDEGPGIPDSHLSDIFSGFHQVEKIPTGEVPGAGLGLTIAKRIMHAHSGNISATSPVPGTSRGTIITVSVPRPSGARESEEIQLQAAGKS